MKVEAGNGAHGRIKKPFTANSSSAVDLGEALRAMKANPYPECQNKRLLLS